MQELNTFETQFERDKFIAEKQQNALDLLRQNSVRANIPVHIEFEIALLGLIAVKPELIDDDTIMHLTELDITQLPLLGQAHLLREPKQMNTSETLSIYAVVHELIHQISFRIAKRNDLNEVERLFEEGVVDNITLDIVNSEKFAVLCQQYNYTPEIIASGYVVERSITGLLDLCLNGEVVRSHIVGDEVLNQKLAETSVDGLVKGEYVARLADSLLGAPDPRQPLADRYARINEMMSVVLLDEANELFNRAWTEYDLMQLIRYRVDFFDAMQLNLDSARNLDENATNDMLEQFKACQNVFDTLAYRNGYSTFDEFAQVIEQAVAQNTPIIIQPKAEIPESVEIEEKSPKTEKNSPQNKAV